MSTISSGDQLTTPATNSPTQNTTQEELGWWKWLRHAMPTAIVIAALGGLAAFGHFTEWTIPKFSELTGGSGAPAEDWCSDHNVPASQCIECNPKLLSPPKVHGWCKLHGVAQCPLEHPEVAQLKSLPEITDAMKERAARALAARPRAENNATSTLYQRRVQFASAEAVDKAGVDIAVVQERRIVEAVVANGEVTYNDTRVAHLPSRVPGTVWRVEKQIGDTVAKDDILVLVDCADIGRAKGELLQAISVVRLHETNVEKLRPLAEKEIVEGRRLREAEAHLQEAQIRLISAQQALVNFGLPVTVDQFSAMEPEEIAKNIRFLGLPEKLTDTLQATTTSSNLFPLRSPIGGVVLQRDAVEGEVVDANKPLFIVGDTSEMWLTLNIRQEDAEYVELGQKVLFRSNGRKDGTPVAGAVSWISTAADEQTRTIQVRAALPNANGQLRSNTFGTGEIILREESQAVVVPNEAVHWDGTSNIVFVRDKNYFLKDSPKFFHVRQVRLGVTNDDMTEIIVGLLPGEVVASKNSVVLEAQLLKSNLGAGCCEADSK